jgi:subtilisin-like proprotein convertase family protein
MAAAAAMTASAAAQCVTGGTGGAIPASGTGDGTWPGTLPSAPMVGTLVVPPVLPGLVLNSVVVHGLSHTYIGDVQFVLQDPTGAQHNLVHRIDFTGTGFGCFGLPAGVDLDLRDPVGSNACNGPALLSCGNVATSGTYQEYFGVWPGGAIDNVPLESIPNASLTGTWTLYAYDWAAIDSGSMTSWDLCFGAPTPPPAGGGGPSMACVTGGGGGAYPSQFTLDGTWPTSLPTGQLTAPLSVSVPAGATKILAVKLHAWSHTWLGDTQIVLQAPGGQMYNVFQTKDSPTGYGCADGVLGDYTLVDASVGLNSCGNPAQNFTCNGTPPGEYRQNYGLWPSGSAGVLNTDLQSIPITSGTWNLIFYDWFVGADDGTLASWDLCFDTPSGPTAYCTAGTSTNGCVPAISASAQPSATLAHACTISIANIEGQKFGIIFYGINNTGFTPAPWAAGSSSFLCVKGPTQRTGSVSSGGTLNACNGVLSLNWNAYQTANPGSVGNPFASGNHVYVQGWYRDPPAPKTTNLSNALDMTMTP